MKRSILLVLLALALSVAVVAKVSHDSVDFVAVGWVSPIMATAAAVLFALVIPPRRPVFRALVAGLSGGLILWIACEAGFKAMVDRTGHFDWEGEVHAVNLVVAGLSGAAIAVLVGIGTAIEQLIAKRRISRV